MSDYRYEHRLAQAERDVTIATRRLIWAVDHDRGVAKARAELEHAKASLETTRGMLV